MEPRILSPQDALRAEWKADLGRLLQPKPFLRLIILGLLSNFASLFLLGIAFMLIWFGAWHALTRLAVYWAPIYKVLASIEGIALAPNQPAWRFAPITGWQVPGLILHTAMSVLFLAFGAALLFKTGFSGQNFICLIVAQRASTGP